MAGMAGRRTLPLQTIALAVSIAAVACGGDSTTPTSPTPSTSQLTIACPAARTATSLQSQPATVTWTAPTTSGGTAPVYVACTPASGASFSVGSTTVACTATGSAASEAASCSFTVTVIRPPQISVTRFMAFGDSITEGQQSLPATVFPVVVPLEDYPYKLNLLLTARYLDQSIVVNNEGVGGEAIATGLGRLPDVMASRNPQVLLLLDGANDLLGSPASATTQYIATKLRDMVRAAKAKVPTVTVLLATFPPQWHGTVPYDHGAGAEFVPELNQRIASVASSEGATLVDLYTPLSADIKRYIGADGLHPTEAGFALIAETFYAAIKAKFEVKTTARR